MGQDIKVQAIVSETTVGEEEVLSYTLEVQGVSFSDIESPQPPEADGLTLQSTIPSTQRNITFVNGALSQSIAYQWSYRPARTGLATIEPVTVTIKGTPYQTERIQVRVVPQTQRPAQPNRSRRLTNPFAAPPPPADEPERSNVGAQDLFIRAVPSARRAYQNEQVTIEYQLFFRNHIQPRHSRLADSWDAEGFWREELDVESRPMPRTVIENGLRYNYIVLKRAAVFPTRTGQLTVEPLRIETEVFAPPNPNDPFGRYFSLNNPYETIERASPAITIEALPLPDGAPASFQGAVGRFDMKTTVSRTEVEVGEPVHLTVRVTGTGNISVLEPPVLHAPGIFETYAPEVQTSINTSGHQVRGTKTFTYLLVPRSNGTFELPAVAFAFFDPQAEHYRTLRSDPATIHVTGTATTPAAAGTFASGLPVDDIAPPMLEAITWRPTARTPLHSSPWAYAALLAPLLLLAFLFGYRRFTHRLATDTAYARSRKAHPLARKHLRQAEQLLPHHDARAFYEELERAVLGFIGNRLNVAELGLTRPQLDDRLAQAGIGPDLREDLRRLLDACDQGRFAPVQPSLGQKEASLDQARELIITLDTAFNQTPTPAPAS